MTKFRLTPVFLLSLAGLIISISIAFYYLFIENKGGMALAGVIAGIYSALMVALLVIERMIIQKLKTSLKKIWIVEVVLITIVLFVYLF